jgi:hypothetical protein
MFARDPSTGSASSALLHPFRLATLAGVAVVVVGVFGPWVEGVIANGSHATLNGFSGAADGAFQLVLCAVLLYLLRSRAAGESRTLIVQLLPALAGLACLAYAVIALRTIDELELLLADQGASPVLSWGLGLDAAGSLLLACGALATTALVMRTYPRHPRQPAEAPLVDRRVVMIVALFIGTVVVGGALGLLAGLLILGSTDDAVIVFFVVAGGIVGWVVADTVRRMGPDWGSRDER